MLRCRYAGLLKTVPRLNSWPFVSTQTLWTETKVGWLQEISKAFDRERIPRVPWLNLSRTPRLLKHRKSMLILPDMIPVTPVFFGSCSGNGASRYRWHGKRGRKGSLIQDISCTKPDLTSSVKLNWYMLISEKGLTRLWRMSLNRRQGLLLRILWQQR